MDWQGSFTSSFFTPVPGEEEQTNRGCYGKALGEWLAEELRKRGVDVEGAIPEDFGWVVMVSRKPFPLWVACGNDDGCENRWVMFAVAEPSVFQRIFKKVDSAAAVSALERQLAEIVKSVPGGANIAWEAA